jgi:putative transcriptional regulator
MAIVKYTLDPNNMPPFTQEDKEAAARRALLTDEEGQARALSDPDNPPMTDEELGRLRTCGFAKRARKATDFSQAEFAATYHFSLGRLRDLEQGRTQADSAILAYLRLITRDPVGVAASLAAIKPVAEVEAV